LKVSTCASVKSESGAIFRKAPKAAAKAQTGAAVAQQAYGRLFDLADEDDNRTRR
jgi:hypothetical protein